MIFYTYIQTGPIRILVIISLILSEFSCIRLSADTSSLFVASFYLRAVSMDAVFFFFHTTSSKDGQSLLDFV